MGDNRPPAYMENDRAVFRFSSSDLCIKALVASLQGYTPMSPPDHMQVRFDEGHEVEQTILDRFLAGNNLGLDRWKAVSIHEPKVQADLKYIVPPHDDQHTVEIPLGTKGVIRGHLDGIAELYQRPKQFSFPNGQWVITEAKGFGPDYWAKYAKHGISAFPYYMAQLSLQMAIGLPAAFIVGEKTYDKDGKLTGIGDVVWHYFDTPPVPIAKIKARMAKAIRLAEAGELPACDRDSYPNPFYYLCDEEKKAKREEEIIEVDDQNFLCLLDELQRAAMNEKMAKSHKSAVSAQVKAHMDALGHGKGKRYRCGDYLVTDVVIQQPARNIKAFESRYPKVTKLPEQDISR